jgi:succinate-semialdehyde dehydrogenase / glutarate-semialdehyde dehydrogenase
MEKQSRIAIHDPANGELVAEYPLMNEQAVDFALACSQEAFRQWKHSPFSERRHLLESCAAILEREKESLALLMQREMGKSLAEGRAEIEKCAHCARYYAREGESHLQDIPVPTEARRSFVHFSPLGTVLIIMPWNFPFWQAMRCALPAIFAGNTVILKHAANVSGCALALERIFREASGGRELFQTILVAGITAEKIIGRREIAAVSFTGSTEIGRRVAVAAGAALKKCVLELGGSDAFVVLEDADIPTAARTAAQSRLINAGQSCIAAKRFLVVKKVIDSFREAFCGELCSLPLAPLARADLRDTLHDQVQRSLSAGAKLLCGGKIPPGPGNFYPATLLGDVRPGMAAFDEELFGPVAALVEAANAEEAIALANQNAFGLGATVFTGDPEQAEAIACRDLDAGSCFGNAMVRSDPRLPFGGIKDSGFGRELSLFGIREFTNLKTVYIGK